MSFRRSLVYMCCTGVSCVAAALWISACGSRDHGKVAFESGVRRPDVLPVMLNKNLPFHYPPALYAQKVQGNVTLRLYIDADGNVVDDSTKIATSSNVPLFDSAAVWGSRELHFVPAKLEGKPMPVSILFPVYFRHPEATPPAGDSVLHPEPLPSHSDTTKKK